MREIEQLIWDWRKELAPRIGPDRLEEIEEHLRELIELHLRSGTPPADAFRKAVERLGSTEIISKEFEKLQAPMWWPARLAIFGMVATFLAAPFLGYRFSSKPNGYLLAAHVFAITIGYVMTFHLGALGICYTLQRQFGEFSASRLRSLSNICFGFSCVAAIFTTIGTVLGMVWASRAWGRAWAWDAKETGAFVTIIWLLMLAVAGRRHLVSAHVLMLMSIVANFIVGMAWFAPNLTGLHAYHHLMSVMLAIVGVGNGVFLLFGLAPAGWLRSRAAR